MLLKGIYTFFLALLLTLFVGMGIAVFYPEPKPPPRPEQISRRLPEYEQSRTKTTVEEKRRITQENKFQKKQKAFQKKANAYNKNVSLISLVAAILILVVSLTLLKRTTIISDGLLLGGTFTLGYSIIRGFAGNDDKFRFFVVTVGLAVTMVLGYLKFIKDEERVA